MFVCLFLLGFLLRVLFFLTFISLVCVCEFGSPQNIPFCFVFLGFCMITQFFHPWIVFDVVKIFRFSVGFKQCLNINALHVCLPPKKRTIFRILPNSQSQRTIFMVMFRGCKPAISHYLTSLTKFCTRYLPLRDI